MDVGAGGGDVSVALASIVGYEGRVYAVDSDPLARNVTAENAASLELSAQVIALTQSAEELTLPEKVDLAYCRFVLLHVYDPKLVIEKMVSVLKPDGALLIQEPITTAGRIGHLPLSMPDANHQDIGIDLPGLIVELNLDLVDVFAEAPMGIGKGPVADYLESLTGVSPGNEPVLLPPLVTVVAKRPVT